jgi:hypothetical protein
MDVPEAGIEPGHDELELGLELELHNVHVEDVHDKHLHHDLVLGKEKQLRFIVYKNVFVWGGRGTLYFFFKQKR